MCLNLKCPPKGGLYKTALNMRWHSESYAAIVIVKEVQPWAKK